MALMLALHVRLTRSRVLVVPQTQPVNVTRGRTVPTEAHVLCVLLIITKTHMAFMLALHVRLTRSRVLVVPQTQPVNVTRGRTVPTEAHVRCAWVARTRSAPETQAVWAVQQTRSRLQAARPSPPAFATRGGRGLTGGCVCSSALLARTMVLFSQMAGLGSITRFQLQWKMSIMWDLTR